MGWVDDVRAVQAPWGFDVGEVETPAVIYANPNDRTTPQNMSEWLVAHMPNATLISSTNANGHCEIPHPDRWRRVSYAWLAKGGEPEDP